MPERVVTWDDYVQRGGSLKYGPPFNSVILASDAVGNQGRIEDVVGNRAGSNPFSLLRIIENYPRLNGYWPSAEDPFITMTDFPIGASVVTAEDPRTTYGVPNIAELNEWAWQILAKTNPSRPHVNVPAAIAELRDLPQLVKGWHSHRLADLANANLQWRFGLGPMISDFHKLCDFVRSANKRMRQLKKLRDGQTLRERCFLGADETHVDHGMTLIHSQGDLLYANARTITSYEMWGSAEWKLLDTSKLHVMDEAQMKILAGHLTTGFTSYGAIETAWELLPWTWLIDWYSNMGDIIAASNNSVGCTWGRLNVMRHSKSLRIYDKESLVKPDWITLDGWFTVFAERKERFPVYPFVPFPLPRLPTLTDGQWSILLSLACLRLDGARVPRL
jgi:hypothetical protein